MQKIKYYSNSGKKMEIQMNMIKNFFVGIIIGIANIIPGVSGGTMAVVFGIYDELVNSITINFKKLWQNKKFLIPLFLGVGSGILLFSKAITFLYKNYPLQTNYCFCGLIAGSIPLLFTKMITRQKNREISVAKIISLILCVIAGFTTVFLFAKLEPQFNKETVESISNLPPLNISVILLLFFSGILGAVAMIIPGISGSLLLLILGVYPVILAAISSIFTKSLMIHAALLLIPCGIGIITGLLCGAKFISFLLDKIPNQTYGAILGLILGSLVVMFPGIGEINDALMLMTCILTFVLGFVSSYFSSNH